MNIFNFEVSTVGTGLFVSGIFGLIISFLLKRKRCTNTVSADNGGVAVGRDNNAQITTTNINLNNQSPKQTYSLLDFLYVVSAIATLIGFGVLIAPLLVEK